MEEYLRGVLEYFPEEIKETPETLAASKLFNIKDYNKHEILDKTWAHAFHQAVA